jgi:hypothetical protein
LNEQVDLVFILVPEAEQRWPYDPVVIIARLFWTTIPL